MVVSDGLTVRAIEEMVRDHAAGREEVAAGQSGRSLQGQGQEAPRASGTGTASPRRLPPPGILELEELLSSHLNTRVKVDLTSKRGKVVVEFATLEDLERIYKLMVGRSESTV